MFDSCTLVVPNVKNVIAAKIFSFYQFIFLEAAHVQLLQAPLV